MDIAGLRKELERRKGANTWKWLAAKIGCSPAYLSDVMLGKRGPGKDMLEYLSLIKVVQYKRLK